MRTAVIILIIGVVLIIPIQMILPFPYGLGTSLFIIIFAIVAAISSKRKHNREEAYAAKSLKYQNEDDDTSPGSDTKDITNKESKDDEWEGI